MRNREEAAAPTNPGTGATVRVRSGDRSGGTNARWRCSSVDDVRVEFGGIVALADLSFTIDEGQICALIGPNGAGKTTLFNCVSRLYQPTSGRIRFDGHEPARRPAAPHRTRRHRPHVPEPRAVPGAHRHRERDGRRATRAVGSHEARRARRARAARAALARPTSPTHPADRSAVRHAEAGRDRARARRRARSCCCSTSRPPGSRTPRSTSSATSCARSATSSTSRCCSSSTTWRWSWRSPRRSSCSTSGRKIAEGRARRDPRRTRGHRGVPRAPHGRGERCSRSTELRAGGYGAGAGAARRRLHRRRG